MATSTSCKVMVTPFSKPKDQIMLKHLLAKCWPLNQAITFRLPAAYSHAVALTFDDGPNPEFTPQVLDILRAHQARATFFLLGNACVAHPDLVERIIQENHAIGIHGMDHSSNKLLEQTRHCRKILASKVNTNLFRPPRGQLAIKDFPGFIVARFRIIIWSHDLRDSLRYENKCDDHDNPSDIVPGDIVLMHDDNPVCLRELPLILDQLKRKSVPTLALNQVYRPPRSHELSHFRSDIVQ